MGLSDHYVASIKGVLYGINPAMRIVDISHTIKPFDVSEASFHVASCYKDFPKGTVHIIGVDTEPIINFSGSDGAFPSVLELDGQFFIANDNGFFGTFLKERRPDNFWRIEDVFASTDLFKFPTKNLYVKIAGRILNGEDINSFGKITDQYRSALNPVATQDPNLIKGYITHIDSFGNAITNIDVDAFKAQGENVPFVIYFKSKENFIDHISISYNEVAQGEKVAVFNENGWLEIAINRGANGSTGGAEKLFGLRKNDMIRVEFTPQGSRTTIDSLF